MNDLILSEHFWKYAYSPFVLSKILKILKIARAN